MAEQQDGTTAEAKPRHRGLKIAIGIVVGILAAVAIAFALYVGDYYHADDTSMAAMASDSAVQVSTLSESDVVFSPEDPEAGIVFYPGGKVQAEAYAPLMRDLAEEGFLCVLVPMPFNLAVFNVNGADGIQAQFPDIDEWILMGHSLGGAMAASYADGHDGEWDGLVLLGSYSTSDLSDNAIDTLTIYGSNDGVRTASPMPATPRTSARIPRSTSSRAATTPSSAPMASRLATATRRSRPRSNRNRQLRLWPRPSSRLRRRYLNWG